MDKKGEDEKSLQEKPHLLLGIKLGATIQERTALEKVKEGGQRQKTSPYFLQKCRCKA